MQKRAAIQFSLLLLILLFISLACKGGKLIPSIFATATPTYTITPSPTATATATATQLPTSTPNPSGISLVPQADGSELFIDSQAGFSMQISPAWVAIPANIDDISSYVEQASETNPKFSEALAMLKNIDSDVLKIIVLDSNADHYVNNFTPNFTVLAIRNPLSAKMPLEKMPQLMGSSIKSQLPDAKVTNSGVEKVNDNFSYSYNELRLPVPTQDGKSIITNQKQVYFSIHDYFVVITLSSPPDVYDDVVLEFNEIIETVQFLDP